MSWAECAAAGMSKAEAARHLGRHVKAADYQSRAKGIVFNDGRKMPDHAKRMSDRINRWHAAGLAHLTDAQRDSFKAMRKAGYSRPEALQSLGVKA